MIGSYRDDDTRSAAERRSVRKFPEDIQRAAQKKPMMLNNAASLKDLTIPPGNRLKALSGDRRGQHSIRINKQWRICFAWREGAAWEVEIEDYH